jgi:hypothetical protein
MIRAIRFFSWGHHRCFKGELVTWLITARRSSGARGLNWKGVKFGPIQSEKKSR